MKDCGLVDLLEAANKNPKGASSLRPSIKLAVNCIVTGHTFKDLSRHAGVAHGTAWSYLTKAAPFVYPADFQRVGPNLVPRDVWKALHSLQSKGDERIGGPLKDLLPVVVERRLPPNSEFHSDPFKLSVLRFARLCIHSTCSSLHTCG